MCSVDHLKDSPAETDYGRNRALSTKHVTCVCRRVYTINMFERYMSVSSWFWSVVIVQEVLTISASLGF